MGLFSGPRRERRAAIVYPRVPITYMGGGSYTHVDVSTLESSLQSVAVRSAVDLIASLVSELPADVFTGVGVNRREAQRPSALDDPAGDGYGRADWVYKALVSWLLRGNLYGHVLMRGPRGVLQQCDLWHPDQVRPQIQDGSVQWFANGSEVPEGQMLHRRVNAIPGVLLGLSPIQQHAADMGLNITLTRFGLDYFRDGAHPGAIIRNTEKEMNETTSRTVKERFLAALRGREPVVFGRGYEYQAISINPEESQFLETRGFSAAECARIFGPGIAEILGYVEKGSTLTYANLQDREVHVLVYALGKWLRRTDRLLSLFCQPGTYVRLNRDALLETTTITRFQAHASALTNKWRTVNEVRAIEDLPPVPWGNQPNMSPGDPLADGNDQNDQNGEPPAQED